GRDRPAQATGRARPRDHDRPPRVDVQTRVVDLAGGRAARAPDRPRGADRHGELGAHARTARPVVRRGMRRLDPCDRPPTAADAAIAQARPSAALRDLDADRLTRIKSQVEQRGRGCERWLPLWRVLTNDISDSADLKQRIGMIRQLVVMRMEMMFRPELSSLP